MAPSPPCQTAPHDVALASLCPNRHPPSRSPITFTVVVITMSAADDHILARGTCTQLRPKFWRQITLICRKYDLASPRWCVSFSQPIFVPHASMVTRVKYTPCFQLSSRQRAPCHRPRTSHHAYATWGQQHGLRPNSCPVPLPVCAERAIKSKWPLTKGRCAGFNTIHTSGGTRAGVHALGHA